MRTPWPGWTLPLPCWTLLRLLSFSLQPVGEAGGGRTGDLPAAGGAAASKGQPLQNGLHAEGQGGEGAPAPPNTALPPGRAAPGPGPCKAPAPTPSPAETPHPGAPEAAKPSSCPEKSPKDAHPGGSPPAPAPAPSRSCSKGPGKEGDALKGKGPEGSKKEEKGAPESSKKEKGAPERSREKGAPESIKKEKGAPTVQEGPTAKGRTKRELALAKKEPEKMKKDAGGGKKEAREIKGPGKTANKSEGPKGEPGGIQGKAEDGAKEAGKAKDKSGKSKEAPEGNKEAPGESKEASTESKEETDQDQVMPLQILSHISGLWVQLCAAPPIRVPSPGGWGGGRRAEGAVPRAGSVPVDGDAAFPARFPACSCTFPLSPPRRLPGTFGTRRRRSGSCSGTASRSVTPFLSCSQLQGQFGVWPWDGSRVTPRQPHHPRAHARLVAATQLKPDVGTPELPAGRVRLRLEADGSVAEVDEDSVQRVSTASAGAATGLGTPSKAPGTGQDETMEATIPLAGWRGRGAGGHQDGGPGGRLLPDGSLAPSLQSNPPSLDLAEDLASLLSLNECSALHTLRQRLRAQLPYTYAGPSLLALGGGHNAASRAAKVRGAQGGPYPLGGL